MELTLCVISYSAVDESFAQKWNDLLRDAGCEIDPPEAEVKLEVEVEEDGDGDGDSDDHSQNKAKNPPPGLFSQR